MVYINDDVNVTIDALTGRCTVDNKDIISCGHVLFSELKDHNFLLPLGLIITLIIIITIEFLCKRYNPKLHTKIWGIEDKSNTVMTKVFRFFKNRKKV